MARLDAAQVASLGDTIPQWAVDGDSIVRTFRFPDFVRAVGFVTMVAVVAEKAFHHPDVDIRWNRVTLRLSTHDEGGLTAKDVELATVIDGLA